MAQTTDKRRRAQRRGHLAEWKAAIALICKGYRILALRHKTKLGEIDLIARKGDLIAIVEVKARPTLAEAVDSVSESSKRRIHNAADLWLGKQRDGARLSIRFDIIAVCPWQWPKHIEDAF